MSRIPANAVSCSLPPGFALISSAGSSSRRARSAARARRTPRSRRPRARRTALRTPLQRRSSSPPHCGQVSGQLVPRTPRTTGAPRRSRDRMRPSRRGPSDAPAAASPPPSTRLDLSRGRRSQRSRALHRRATDSRLPDDTRQRRSSTTRCTAAFVHADLHEIRVVPATARELDARPPARPRRGPVEHRSASRSSTPCTTSARARRSCSSPTADDHSYWHNRADGRGGRWCCARSSRGTAAWRSAESRWAATARLLLGAQGHFCAVGGHSPALWFSGADSAPGAFDDAAGLRATRHRQPPAALLGAGLDRRRHRRPVSQRCRLLRARDPRAAPRLARRARQRLLALPHAAVPCVLCPALRLSPSRRSSCTSTSRGRCAPTRCARSRSGTTTRYPTISSRSTASATSRTSSRSGS